MELRIVLVFLGLVTSAQASDTDFIPTPETRIAPGLVSGDGIILAPFCVTPGENRLCKEAIFYKLTERKAKNSRMIRDRFSVESIDRKREYFENGKIYQYVEASKPLSGAAIQHSLELFQGKLEQAGYRVLVRHFKKDDDRKFPVGPFYNFLWFAPISGGLVGAAAKMVGSMSGLEDPASTELAFKVGVPVMTALFIYGATESIIGNIQSKNRAKHYEEDLTQAFEALFSPARGQPVRVKDYIFRDVLGFVQSDFWGWYAVRASEEDL